MPVYLGLDYGLRRIGIAASDPGASLAFAVETHVEGRDGSIISRLEELISSRSVQTLVLGLPLTADGREGDIAQRVRHFAARLQQEFTLDVVLWDERFTSAEADRWLKGSSGKDKENRDSVAAQIMLQSYLDSLRAADSNDRGSGC